MKIAVVGLGYVGLPLAVAFSKHYTVIGYDINKKKIDDLRNGIDSTKELAQEEVLFSGIEFTADPGWLKEADFVIVSVPTPLHEDSKQPDLSPLENVSRMIGENMKKNVIISFESTVYPGVTEDVCVPVLERYSGLKCGLDFKVAYSPERINPGDKEHTLEKITKVVSGMDNYTLEKAAEVYGKICPVYKVSSIKVAEASKVIENTQRDLNIAFMNELSLIFHRLNIDTEEVLKAASTKWNFHKYHPGLVGGECIGVDPYYLTHRAQKEGYYPKVILSGREVNEYIALHVAKLTMQGLNKAGKVLKDSKVLVMGLTFKEDVPDIRNSKIKETIKELREFNIEVLGCEPNLSKEEVRNAFNIENFDYSQLPSKVDAVILAQKHKNFKNSVTLDSLIERMNENPVLMDVKWFFDKEEAEKRLFFYERL